MSQNEMVIFTKTSDFLAWLLPHTNHFPKAHRHTFTQRLLNAAFDLRELLEEANLRQGDERLHRLALADEAIARVRIYLRLASKWKWQSEAQYEHCAMMLRARFVEYRAGKATLPEITSGVRAWVSHASYGNTVGLRKAVLGRVLAP